MKVIRPKISLGIIACIQFLKTDMLYSKNSITFKRYPGTFEKLVENRILKPIAGKEYIFEIKLLINTLNE